MNKINLRKVFVQLLFSLAIGQVAIRSGYLVIAGATVNDYYYSYLHLLLCVIIITTSWVGWYNSKSPHNSDVVASVFSLQYIILLVDMFLVICYFIIVSGAEVSSSSKLTDIPKPNSHIEVFWSMVIFSTYFIWDIITKLVKFTYTYDCLSKKINRKITWAGILHKRIWPTILCCICSIIIYEFMNDESKISQVALIDVTLIALFLTFRGFKEGVTKLYQIQEKFLPEEIVKEIESGSCDVTYPVDAEDVRYLHFAKYFCTKIVPPLIMISCFIIYILSK